jgi:hypothetical protein
MRTTGSLLLACLVASPSLAQTVPTRAMPRAEVEFAEPFTELRSVRELSDGRVIVVDGRDLSVQLVDLRAATTTPIGRKGAGPGEYQWPGALWALPGDTTLLQDQAGGRLMLITPDGRPGAFLDLNPPDAGARRFIPRFADARGRLYAEAQPVRTGPDGTLQLADSTAIERLDRATGRRDTVAMRAVRADAGTRLVNGMVFSQPSPAAFPAFDAWLVAADGRVAMVYHDPYRVDWVRGDGSVTRGQPIPYTRVRVDDAVKRWHREEREKPGMAMVYQRDGGTSMQVMRRPYTAPASWPDVLPPYVGAQATWVAPDGNLWVKRALSPSAPATFDVIDGAARLVERVTLPARTALLGFGNGTVYLVRSDDDDLQYLQRYRLPTAPRP